jgi:WD40 repeat protein
MFDGKFDVWDLQTGGLIGTLKGHTNSIRSIVFSPYGDMIATSSGDGTMGIWNTFSLDCRCVLVIYFMPSICWSHSGSKVVLGCSDAKIRVWDVSEKQCSPTLTILTGGEVYSVASLPDSSTIAAGSTNGTITLFDP